MFAHRFRRKDQNEVQGYPPDRWGPWYAFPSYEVGLRNARFLAVIHGWEVQLKTGEVLKQHSEEVGKVKLVKELKKEIRPRVQGSRDPDMPGRILVPLTRTHPTLRYTVTGTPPETFYRYNEKKRTVECLVTMMPGGLLVAWDTCGNCASSVQACKCKAVRPPRSIIHLYEIATGEPFEKPRYEPKIPTFERKKEIPSRNGKLVDKQNPIGSFLKDLPKSKTPLVKEKTVVPLTKGTSLADFDETAEKSSERKKAAFLKSLKRTPLTKG
jgi:hypothetical protein